MPEQWPTVSLDGHPISETWYQRTVRVAGYGADFNSIQAAINYAVTQTPTAAGRWTILVYPGTYNEIITMAQYVDVVGMDKESVIIPGTNVTSVTMADDTRIANLTINMLATAGGSAYGIEINDAGCRIEDINMYIDRDATGGAECVGIIENTGAAATTIYLRNVRIRCEQVVNTNTRAISILQDNKTIHIEASYIQGSDYGLELIAASTVYSFGNYYQATAATTRALYLNDAGALVYLSHDELLGINIAAGVVRGIPEVSIPVPNPSSNIGDHPSELLIDGLAVTSRFNLYIPDQFHQLHTAVMIIVPLGTGNLRRAVATDFGEVCAAEVYNTHTDALADDTNVAVTINILECVDIAGALTGIVARDQVGIAFTRHGENALDTVAANCHLLSFRMQYV